MKACKQTASTGAAATDSKSAVEERKPLRKGKKPKGKLALKSNGAEKPKNRDLPDIVTRGLAVMSIAEEMSEYDDIALLAFYTYKNIFWRDNFKGVCDRPSIDAIREKAAENWKLFNDSEKAPYVAQALVNRRIIFEVHEEVKLTRMMTDKMMNLKM